MMRLALAACALALALSAAAARADSMAWNIEEDSRLGFIARQLGAPVEALFGSFEAEIVFAPDALGESRIAITIEMASVDSRNRERDDVIRSAALFDTANWPTASFEAERFEATGEDLYEAHGRLTLKGVTRAVVLPFSLTIAPDPQTPERLRAQAAGELTIQRLDYGIGQGLWQDTSVVADEIVIFIEISATRPAN
ncbi:MAG: YceI family protein [Proteobacteria bacterium]|nr:YceI family protein [Pseudomonadota bacterium]